MNISQKKLEKSKGRLEIKIKDQNLQKLYQQGSLKALMPDFHENLKQLMLINTAGGITSGDEYDYEFEIDSSDLCISTQAAEKIYSGLGNPANLEINLTLLNNSRLFWLPKELILFKSLFSFLTISNKPIYLTGLKKCVIQKSFFSTSVKCSDKTLIGIEDVFDETIAPSFLTLNIFSYI